MPQSYPVLAWCDNKYLPYFHGTQTTYVSYI